MSQYRSDSPVRHLGRNNHQQGRFEAALGWRQRAWAIEELEMEDYVHAHASKLRGAPVCKDNHEAGRSMS